jgi:hypothetical protein
VNELIAPIEGAEHQSVAGVEIDLARAGTARVKRLVYPAGFRWSEHMRPVVGGDRCRHAHVGFLARGAIAGEYPDGCRFSHRAPAFVAIEPGHDAWVEGDEPAVLIEFDFEGKTAERLGLREHTRS